MASQPFEIGFRLIHEHDSITHVRNDETLMKAAIVHFRGPGRVLLRNRAEFSLNTKFSTQSSSDLTLPSV